MGAGEEGETAPAARNATVGKGGVSKAVQLRPWRSNQQCGVFITPGEQKQTPPIYQDFV